jgi:hypothetical protein
MARVGGAKLEESRRLLVERLTASRLPASKDGASPFFEAVVLVKRRSSLPGDTVVVVSG